MKVAKEKSFRLYDKDGTLWTVEYRMDDDLNDRKNSFGMTAESSGLSAGQSYDSIVPRTKEQKELINIWKKYHLKDITEKQKEYIQGVIDAVIAESETFAKEEGETLDDPKAKALAQNLDINASKISTEDQETYNVGKSSYLVLTDEEADKLALEREINLLDEIGFEGLSIGKHVKKDWFEEALNEMNISYAEDIKSEGDREYDNRLVREMYEADLLNDNDFEIDDDGEVDYSQPKEESIDSKFEAFVEYLNDNAGDPVDYYVDNFGQQKFDKIVKDNNLVDVEALAEEILSVEGRGAILNGWDGSEEEEEVDGVTYYIYRN